MLVAIMLLTFMGACTDTEDPSESSSDTEATEAPQATDASGRKIPTYTGMSLSHDKPSVQTISASKLSVSVDQSNPFKKSEFSRNLTDEVKDAFKSVADESGDFFAAAGQDIYIIVHISNPDNFAMHSLTFDGKEYTADNVEEGRATSG